MKVCFVTAVFLLAVYAPLPAQPANIENHFLEILNQLTPEVAGEEALLPSGFRLDHVLYEDQNIRLQLSLSEDYLSNTLDEVLHEELIEQVMARTTVAFASIAIEARNDAGQYVPLSHFLKRYATQMSPAEINQDPLPFTKGRKEIELTRRSVQPRGFLSGKTVWLSAGHGWKYDPRYKDIKTQRRNHHGIVEDFATVELVNYFLLKYLYQAGAEVWTVRERDMNPNEVIVCNEDRGKGYEEKGNWQTSSSKGYQGSSYRYTISRPQATASASFQPNLPEAGLYWVSVHYRTGLNRSVDTRYSIYHAGGVSEVSINQEVHGSTWVYLGQFYFNGGTAGKVVLTNESEETGQAVIADAVRFGGGTGDGTPCEPKAVSREPRFEECASFYASRQGFPDCLNDVIVRPKYAEWELAKGGRRGKGQAIYLSLHTNANGGRGTESFVHTRRAVRGSWSLQHFVHKEVIRDLRREYDPQWKDRGRKAADFGELRGLKTMPGMLLEVAFHDHPKDAKALKDPEFRRLVGRAVYRGVVRYFANQEGKRPQILPEPPTHLYARSQEDGSVEVGWRAPGEGYAAAHYQVYFSEHGKAFSRSRTSKQARFIFKDLQVGRTYFFRVTAVNRGGESFPTPVVAVRIPEKGEQHYKYLMVDGFDRLDAGLAPRIIEKKPRYSPLGETRRLLLEKMNSFDYMAEHAAAFDQAGMAFDGASNEAVADQLISMIPYDGVDWYLGRESVKDQTLSRREQELLRKYLNNGGNLLISGSELAYDLDERQNGRTFYREYLKARYKGDNAASSVARPLAASGFELTRFNIRNQDYDSYRMNSPDYIYPIDGGIAFVEYGNGKTAGVAYRGKFGVLNLGFPLESIGNVEDRFTLVYEAVKFLHHGKGAADFITYVPGTFSQEISIDLSHMAEGEAVFRMQNSKGHKMYERSWQHYGKRIRTFHMGTLPDGRYEYELSIANLKQSGFITKVKLK